ncbi:MAG: GGDEF domain-containing protein, partial [Magnetovibrio sp.]|nr:GGDEF domain-containing protein [Magnetovibrio sp.]
FYAVIEKEKNVEPIFVGGLENPSELWCDPDILINAEACRCKRTAADVSSFQNENICPRFSGNSKGLDKMVHVCSPMMLSGHIGGVLQLVMTEEEAQSRTRIAQMAQIYLNQAAPVIEARQLMQSLKETAMRDPMTGLYNRRFLEDYIDSMLAGLLRQKASMGILMCDVDFFKKVNDNYGHDVGDEVIKGLSNILAGAVRDADLAIRYGGEEFILLLPHTDEEGAMLLAERVRTELESFTFQTPLGPLKKTLSVGISMFPDDGSGFWECVKYSDIALYKAKESGRNKCLRFNKDMWDETEDY